MALIRHPVSGLVIGEGNPLPLKEDDPDLGEVLLDKALEGMILSASGWRGIFAANGDEESTAGEIRPVHRVIVSAGAKVFADYLKKNRGTEHPVIIVGMDTRPTGEAIADSMIRTFIAEGCRVRFAFITAAPEIMAYARGAGEGDAQCSKTGDYGPAQGFVYISASHNPVGHNGIKFGLTDGGVLPGEEAGILINNFRVLLSEPDRIARAAAAINRADIAGVEKIYTEAPEVKQAAYGTYLRFTREVAAGTAVPLEQDRLFDSITRGLREHSLGMVIDFNGSARTLSIDREFLGSLGIRCHCLNDKPREIAHRIVPEGESLEPCRRYLEEVHKKDPSVIMGYVPDCDGDRGNLVIWDEGEKQARSLEAQEVFALACVSELAHQVWTGELTYDLKGNAMNKVALAVNDPTSMRIDRIAKAFDVSVFRAEVGEANVVSLARKLREQGYRVRILGEGSAGGNITHPAAVRDPINTVMSLVKLLTIRSTGSKKGFFEFWCSLADKSEVYRPDFSLADIIATLPAFITTGAYTPEAVLRVKTADHGLLKSRYQRIFLREWEERREALKLRYGITGWEAAAYIGIEEKRGLADFGEARRGGLKITFINRPGNETAAIWMRGSGTEPVFRIMADVEGSDKRMERDLIEWQRHLVTQADQAGN
ncbi:MAG: phosphatidylglycerol lysyltransferase [Treponema sp.]|jgi:phosphoglucomutase|nr:phosphatidylglycerol lysyltransferase [Treponema sp.]